MPAMLVPSTLLVLAALVRAAAENEARIQAVGYRSALVGPLGSADCRSIAAHLGQTNRVRRGDGGKPVYHSPLPEDVYAILDVLRWAAEYDLVLKQGGGDSAAWFVLTPKGLACLEAHHKPVLLPEDPRHTWWRDCQECGLRPDAPEPKNERVFAFSSAQAALVPALEAEVADGF